jgi:hypothetical protein
MSARITTGPSSHRPRSSRTSMSMSMSSSRTGASVRRGPPRLRLQPGTGEAIHPDTRRG